jgi:hypothetical protein
MRRLVALVGRFLLIVLLSTTVLALAGWIIAALTDRGVKNTIALALLIGGAVPVVGWAIGGASGPRADPVAGHLTPLRGIGPRPVEGRGQRVERRRRPAFTRRARGTSDEALSLCGELPHPTRAPWHFRAPQSSLSLAMSYNSGLGGTRTESRATGARGQTA